MGRDGVKGIDSQSRTLDRGVVGAGRLLASDRWGNEGLQPVATGLERALRSFTLSLLPLKSPI